MTPASVEAETSRWEASTVMVWIALVAGAGKGRR